MEPGVANLQPAAATATRRGFWPAWLLSAAALLVSVVPGAGSWAALLFALATAHWAWLAYGGIRPDGGTGGRDGESLRDLMVASSRAAGNDARALRADLARVRVLVHDAAVTLGDGFQGVSERLRRENQVVAVMMARMCAERSALNHAMSEELARISAAGACANDSLEALARALQFEDVVRQLLEYCDRQAAGIGLFIDGAAGLIADAQPVHRLDERREKLAQACKSYLEHSARCAHDRQRHVSQTSMQAGKVELF
jgi:hypothetical protein